MMNACEFGFVDIVQYLNENKICPFREKNKQDLVFFIYIFFYIFLFEYDCIIILFLC